MSKNKIKELFPEYEKYRTAKKAVEALEYGDLLHMPRNHIREIIAFHRLAEEVLSIPAPKFVEELEKTLFTYNTLKAMIKEWEEQHPYAHLYYKTEKGDPSVTRNTLKDHYPDLYHPELYGSLK